MNGANNMSNFDFMLKNNIFKTFAEASVEAEKSIAVTNVSCTIMCRRALELAVKWLYANDTELRMPYQNNLSSLVHDITFKNMIDKSIFKEIIYIIKLGNFSVHSNKKVTREEAVVCLKYLFDFMNWISYCYDSNYKEVVFNEAILPSLSSDNLKKEEREELENKLYEKDVELEKTLRENEELRRKLTSERTSKKESYNFKADDINEFETRKRFIDLDLEIAGWVLKKNAIEEVLVTNMTETQEEGFVDYVLFSENEKPLAIVEAKRTSIDAKYGQQQAKLYADCLEKEYGQRPIIYYTNGIDIYMWDDLNYPERKVAGFYTQDELQLLIKRRQLRENLEHIYVNEKITNRPYQLEAVKSVCEAFNQKHRKSLLVMATGTGKTRTAISIVDVLTSKGWIKNVLFLADRTELVKQAEKNFKKLLPDMSCCNLLSSKKENPEDSRMIFSTYQTMINCIDTVKSKKGNKLFTPGHFDLIIIDEAHRSIYKKYQAIFDYFDGLLVGLTATPRNDVDKNTYKFFELENNVPTFVYEYDEAVKDGYLVNYHTIKTNTEFLDRGIKYSNLKEEDREEYENLFDGEDIIPDQISATAINSWLFNRDTIKLILETLMEKGLKVEGGDKLGKTIIFAKNHRHAEEIVKVFNSLYPKYNGEFARVIDNQVNFASTLIEIFEKSNKLPQIAVSVDMLDTGIDVPEVLNLVFFKPVKSKIKFWQMIGRGTRLCENLFGECIDKQQFYIFDCCRNFEFFEENERRIEGLSTLSLTEKIYSLKLDLIIELESMKYQSQDNYRMYRDELVDEFISRINGLNRESFIVRNKMVFIEKYCNKDKWQHIDCIAYNEIKENLINIFMSEDTDEYAKRFDNLVYGVQVGKIKFRNTNRQIMLLTELMRDLRKLGTISQVFDKKEFIEKALDVEYWERASFFDIEKMRNELRGLIKFIDNPPRNIFVTDIEDILMVEEEHGEYTLTQIGDYSNYKRKVTKFLNDNLDNLVIYKIKHNQKLNDIEKKDLERIMFEELGSNSEFVENFGNKNVIQVVRNIVGLDSEIANDIFSKYINDNRLNSKQIQFVKMLIEYVIKNGTISLQVLTEDPFSSLGAVSEVFEDNVGTFKQIREDIEEINRNAEMFG